MVNAGMLCLLFLGKHPQIRFFSSCGKYLRIVLMSAVSVAAAYGFRALAFPKIGFPRTVSLGLAVMLAVGVYLLLMKRFGFEEVPSLGEDFDPEKHNAVMRESGDTPGKILEVFQKGYRVKDKIIRYAMVKVCAE